MIYNILDFGAVPDGKTLNTATIQKAIDTCYQNGGGRVVIENGTYMSGTIVHSCTIYNHFIKGAILCLCKNFLRKIHS